MKILKQPLLGWIAEAPHRVTLGYRFDRIAQSLFSILPSFFRACRLLLHWQLVIFAKDAAANEIKVSESAAEH
jgi:hypothetical protein